MTVMVVCGCCGNERAADQVAALGRHPDVHVCRGCAQWLAARAGAVRSTPILATRDMAEAKAFYEAAGFAVDAYDDGYAFVQRGGAELLHLVRSDIVDPSANAASCYLHSPDPDRWHAAWSAAGLPVGAIEDRPWGMREFEVRDPSGNLIRVGRNS